MSGETVPFYLDGRTACASFSLPLYTYLARQDSSPSKPREKVAAQSVEPTTGPATNGARDSQLATSRGLYPSDDGRLQAPGMIAPDIPSRPFSSILSYDRAEIYLECLPLSIVTNRELADLRSGRALFSLAFFPFISCLCKPVRRWNESERLSGMAESPVCDLTCVYVNWEEERDTPVADAVLRRTPKLDNSPPLVGA